MTRRRLMLGLVALGAGMAGLVSHAAAQSAYPNKPIKLIVPYPAGGIADLGARNVADRAAAILGQNIVVENRPGANGNLGTMAVKAAAPDGYTLLAGSLYLLINPLIDRTANYKVKDFTPIVQTSMSDYAIVVGANQPYKTLADFIDAARRKPNDVTVSNPGTGSPNHLALELLARDANVQFRTIPYKGQPAAIMDMIQGLIAAQATHLGLAIGHIESQKLRALAVSSPKRLASLPQVPTMEEAGFGKSVLVAWSGILAPRGTPPEIVQRLNAAFNQAIATPESRTRMEKQFQTPVGGTAEQFEAVLTKETALWTDIITKRGIKAEE